MAVILGNIPDKTFGWVILGSMLISWAILVPVVLAIDSRIVFGLFATLFTAWLLIIAARMIQLKYRLIGWGIVIPLSLFLILSFFTTLGVPLLYITFIFTCWAGYRLAREPQGERRELVTEAQR